MLRVISELSAIMPACLLDVYYLGLHSKGATQGSDGGLVNNWSSTQCSGRMLWAGGLDAELPLAGTRQGTAATATLRPGSGSCSHFTSLIKFFQDEAISGWRTHREPSVLAVNEAVLMDLQIFEFL